MNRKTFVAASLFTLVNPSKLFASNSKTIPYTPLNARPYFKPGPELIRSKDMLDPKIRDAVLMVNESGWIWTVESCQGHSWSDHKPMMRLVCRMEDRDKMLGKLFSCASVGRGKPVYGRGQTQLLIYRHTPAPRGWFEVRVFANTTGGAIRDSLAFWRRFAEAVN